MYRLGHNPGEIGSTSNAWLGAMYVWNDIAKRYLGLEGFGFSTADHRRVWNAWKYYQLPQHEIIVLMSTLDNALVKAEDRDAVIAAFEQYGNEHPNSSLTAQARILRDVELRPGDFIGWAQTSVSGFWGSSHDGDHDEIVWYNPHTENKHFDAFEEAVEAFNWSHNRSDA